MNSYDGHDNDTKPLILNKDLTATSLMNMHNY